MSSIAPSVREFLAALAVRRTYSPMNPYVIFGFLWGLPVPLFSIGIDLLVSGRPLSAGEIITTFAQRPVHLAFALHPILFAVVFGAMGTIKFAKEAKIEQHVHELALANARLLELDGMKKDFVANVTHELKTPLVSVLGYTEMLLDGRLGEINERQRNGLAVALRNVQRLERLLDELLDTVRLEAGKLTLDKKPVDLREIVENATRAFEPMVGQKGLRFTVTLDDARVRVLADPERIQRVLANLISNAIKFTDRGGTVNVKVEHPSGGRVVLRVCDTGRGIPEKFRPHLFERFSRADQGPPGTGLGLAIVKAILDAHGSRMEVQSREGQGTQMSFDLECVSRGD